MKEQVSQTKKGSVLRTSMYVAVLIGLAAFLIFSILAAITFGNADLSLKDVYSVIAYKLFHIKSLSAYAEGAVHDVVWLIRLPRVLLALAVGMALSVCGVVMQAIVQNPLADPYVLGISSGASLGATLAIMLGVGGFLGGNSVGVPAFIGAMVTSFAVIAIANMGGKATSAKLILPEWLSVRYVLLFPILLSISPRQKCSNRSNEVVDGKPCRRKLEQSRCNASCYIDLCNYFLDAIS